MPSNRRAAETATGQPDGPRVLKKYPNRRLYDTQTSSYITLTDVKQMVLDAEVFEVRDAKSGEELTRSILLQIILEEESAGMPMFSTQMLAQLIRFYGHTMQGMMGDYMERNLQGFVDLQRRFTDQTGGLYEGKAFNPEAWAQFMAVQPPAMQHMMSNYLGQSKSLFTQMQEMQEKMQKQAESFFPGMAGFTPPAPKP
jgi:polyhydroxyalkanoate synthesis repressor PhaR